MVLTAAFIDRHALAISTVTLNGHPARISGLRDDYARVVSLRGEGVAQFDWKHVDAIVREHAGQFTTD